MKCQILFSRKNKKNISSWLSAENAHSVVSVKVYPVKRTKLMVEITKCNFLFISSFDVL